MNTSHENFLKLKIIILGASNVGKSALILRFTEDVFKVGSYKPTLGVDFTKKIIHNTGKLVELQIWDTGGEERFRSLTKAYYRNIHGCLLVYDVTDRESFNALHYWLEDLTEHGNKMERRVIVANKSDLSKERVVTEYEGKVFATMKGVDYCECSAKTGKDVELAFKVLVDNMVSSSITDKLFRQKLLTSSLIDSQVANDEDSEDFTIQKIKPKKLRKRSRDKSVDSIRVNNGKCISC